MSLTDEKRIRNVNELQNCLEGEKIILVQSSGIESAPVTYRIHGILRESKTSRDCEQAIIVSTPSSARKKLAAGYVFWKNIFPTNIYIVSINKDGSIGDDSMIGCSTKEESKYRTNDLEREYFK